VRQPSLTPYRPPAWAEDAAVGQGPSTPPGPAPAGFPTQPPQYGTEAHAPYRAPGTPLCGTPPAPRPYGADPGTAQLPGTAQHPAGRPGQVCPPGHAPYPGWPAPPGWSASFAPPPRQNGLALASMITSLAGIAMCLFPGVVGLILGIVALQQISRDGTTGRGYAVTGIAVGAASTMLLVLSSTTMWGNPA
jgi:hypothetical protein